MRHGVCKSCTRGDGDDRANVDRDTVDRRAVAVHPPTADFYRIDTALSTPQVDVGSWQLEIKGMVDRPYTLVYDELLRWRASRTS